MGEFVGIGDIGIPAPSISSGKKGGSSLIWILIGAGAVIGAVALVWYLTKPEVSNHPSQDESAKQPN